MPLKIAIDFAGGPNNETEHISVLWNGIRYCNIQIWMPKVWATMYTNIVVI